MSVKVTLCGSTRFKEDFIKMNAMLTMNSVLIFSVGFFPHSNKTIITRLQKARLDVLHMEKILESDAIVVLTDPTFYIGESTEREIAMAELYGRGVFYAVPEPQNDCEYRFYNRRREPFTDFDSFFAELCCEESGDL